MPLSLMHRQYTPLARTVIFFLLLLLVTGVAKAATFTVTTPGQQTLTNKFLPYAGSGTQLLGNSPAWRDSAGVLGINNYLEGLETLTPAAAVNLDFSTWRTKRITLNQNTVFTAVNIPSVSTNVQTMLLEVIGDGAFTVSFANVTFQTPTITTPDAGVVTLYALRGDSGAVKGYTQAISATGIGPLTAGYVPLANATNNVTDSILYQPSTINVTLTNNAASALSFKVSNATNTATMGVSNGQAYFEGNNAGDSIKPTFGFGSGDGYFHSPSIHAWEEDNVSIMALYYNNTPFNGAGALSLGSGAIYFGGTALSFTNSISSGQGSPEGVLAQPTGSFYLDRAGAAYVKTSGAGNTGWTAVSTGGGGGGGNLFNTGTPIIGNVPYYSDTTGTNVAPSGALILGASTNASVVGVLSGHSAVFTNTVSANGINLTGIESFGLACSDETTPLTTGTAKVTFRMPYAFTVTAVRASLTTAQASGSIFTVDINEGGTSILSTKLTIDNTETTSTTAVTAPVISDSAVADDASITIDIDQIGNGSATGLKVWIIGHQ